MNITSSYGMRIFLAAGFALLTPVALAAQPDTGVVQGVGKNHHSSIGGEAENSAGQDGRGMVPNDASFNLALANDNCYSNWWVSGSHSWKSTTYFLYGKTTLTARSWTRYGTSTGPCEIPLVVDEIRVVGNTLSRGNRFAPVARVDATAFNTDSVEQSNTGRLYSTGNTIKACGARVDHIAKKSGVTWSSQTQSGCTY